MSNSSDRDLFDGPTVTFSCHLHADTPVAARAVTADAENRPCKPYVSICLGGLCADGRGYLYADRPALTGLIETLVQAAADLDQRVEATEQRAVA